MFLLFIFFLSVSIKLSTQVALIFLFVCCFCPFFVLLLTFLHLVWKSRFREQKTKNVALCVQMFCIIPTGWCFCFLGGLGFFVRGEAGRVLGCERSQIVEKKCMAHGSLIFKKKKKI